MATTAIFLWKATPADTCRMTQGWDCADDSAAQDWPGQAGAGTTQEGGSRDASKAEVDEGGGSRGEEDHGGAGGGCHIRQHPHLQHQWTLHTMQAVCL